LSDRPHDVTPARVTTDLQRTANAAVRNWLPGAFDVVARRFRAIPRCNDGVLPPLYSIC
jgi:hypothetical protein